ncbi:MAG: LysR family transcriptional regulator [Pseudomonadota bacterium]
MKLDPSHLEMLAAIVDNGGLTEGAEALGKSQPSLSRSLATLEARLGVALFQPHRRPLQPTEFCLQLAQEGRKILEARSTASDLVARHRGGYTGAVRLGGTPIFMDGVVAPVLASFQLDHPDIRIDQRYGYPGEVLSQLQSGTLDIGIVPIRAAEVPEGIDAVRILPGRNVIACRQGHPLARKPSVSVSDIAQHSWIAPPPESPLYQDLRAVLHGIGVRDFKVSFSGGSLASVVNVLSNSDALTVLPHSVVSMLGRQNALAELAIRIGDPDRHLYLLAPQGDGTPSARLRLVSFVAAAFSSPTAPL